MIFIYGFLLFSALIVIHEIGHFVVAKMMGVKVEVFSIGFGKRLFGWKVRGTDFIVSLIPLGGYIRMKGNWDDDEDSEKILDKDSYDAKTPLQKIAISFGGPLLNILFALGVYTWIAYKPYEIRLPIVGEITIGASSAEKEGFVIGDRILKINGYEISTWNDFSEVLNHIEPEEFIFEVNRSGKIVDFSLDEFEISPANVIEKIQPTFLDSIKEGSVVLFLSAKDILIGYKEMFLSFFNSGNTNDNENTENEAELSSVIGMSQELGNVALEENNSMFWIYLAFYSLILGVFNLIPIVPLDGGKIVLESYVLIFRKQPNKKVEDFFFYAGILIVLSIIILGTYNDIVKLFSN